VPLPNAAAGHTAQRGARTGTCRVRMAGVTVG
jgi:hypothetical protein